MTKENVNSFKYFKKSIIRIKKDFKKKYPKVNISNWDSLVTGEDRADWIDGDFVIIAEYFEKVPVKREIVLLSDGRSVEIDELSELDMEILASNQVQVVKQRQVDSYDIHYHKITGFEVLESQVLKTRYFPIIPVYGEIENIEGKEYINGAIRPAKDPQRLHNYWHTAAAETIALQPKSPFIVTLKQVANHLKFWDRANTDNLPYLPRSRRSATAKAAAAIHAKRVVTASGDYG